MPPTQSTEADELGELFEVLSHPHRRQVLTKLAAHDDRERDEFEIGELRGDDVHDDVTISLVHNHLPRLADSGFIAFGRERRVVTRGHRFHEIEPLIDIIVAHQDELPANWPDSTTE